MGDLSPVHLLIVLVVAVVILGPSRLPEVGTALGRTIREFRGAVGEMPDAFKVGTAAPGAAAALVPDAAPRPPTADSSVVPATPAPSPPAPAQAARVRVDPRRNPVTTQRTWPHVSSVNHSRRFGQCFAALGVPGAAPPSR